MKRRGRGDRLKALQRLKEIREDQAKAEVVRANQEVDEAGRQVLDQREVTAKAGDLPHMTMPPAMIRALQIAGWASVEQLKLAEEEYERTVERREVARRNLTEAAIGRRSIEKLAQRREQEAVARRREAADRAMDELYLLSRRRP